MRRRQAKKHPLIPDPRFNDTDVTYFVNNLMLKGKKSTAFDIFYSAIDMVTERTGEDGLEQWKQAVTAITPNVEVRKHSMAVKWIISYARLRNEKTMADRLAAEIIAANKGEGATFKKKEDTHRMAEANKAFSHFRF
jgi:small subunit ribosomal protein S7